MVSRDQGPQIAVQPLIRGVFSAWRRALSHAGWWVRRNTAAPTTEMRIALASIVLAALGTAGGLAAGTLGDGSYPGAVVFALGTTLWAAFRLVVVLLTAPESTRRSRERLFVAWAIGLAPYALGFTTGLRAVAFVASALLTLKLLAHVYGDSSASVKTCVIAFGGQGIAALASWVMLNGLVFLPLARA